MRLISEDGKQLGIVELRDALDMALQARMDLVEIQPNADPPVARIMDRGKFLFKKSKEKSAAKKKQKKIKVKEIKFRPTTDKNDYEVKLRNLRGFLEGGDKVKITVWFRGREMSHQQLGIELLDRVKNDLEELGKVEHFPKLEGRQLVMILAPRK